MKSWLRIGEWVRRVRKPRPLGLRGEFEAARFLRRRGYKIIARGDSDSLGELDLIAVDGRTVVFVEVKTRSSHAAGHPSESVHSDKQQRLTRLALRYLKRNGLLEQAARFDVVAVTWPDGKRRPIIEHYPNAFPAVGGAQMFN